MKALFLTAFVAATTSLALASCTETPPEDPTPVIQITGGYVQGVLSDDWRTVIYRGLPYAAPPVGELRWKKPQPVEPWDTVLIADTFSDAAWQGNHDPLDGVYGTEFYYNDPMWNEDCLYLNVWTPFAASDHPERKLPVALWVHGGAFTGGWGFEDEFDGEAWAQRGVILVTINYRLGVFGFLRHPELAAEDDGHSGNYGLYDQIAALRWVRDNIAQFGGDPDNITIFGQSAGARSVKNLVTSPLSRDMVAKCIVMSGGGLGPEDAPQPAAVDYEAQGKDIMDRGGLTSLQLMREASADSVFAVAASYPAYPLFGQRTDDVVLPQQFDQAVYRKQVADIPYMMGSVADDLGNLGEGIRRFGQVRDSLSEQPTYLYYFERPLPDDGRPCLHGSFHSSELWFVFGTLARSWRPFTEADYELSSRIIDHWTNFCRTGNPNGEAAGEWRPATQSDPFVMTLKLKEERSIIHYWK